MIDTSDADARTAERLARVAGAPELASLLSRRWHVPHSPPASEHRPQKPHDNPLRRNWIRGLRRPPNLRLLLLLPLFVFTASFAPPAGRTPEPIDVVFLGDSVSLGRGATAPENGFSSIIAQRLDGVGFQTQSHAVISALGGVYVDLREAREAVNTRSQLIIVEVGAHSVIENQALPLSTYRVAYGMILDCLQHSGAGVVVGTVPSLNWATGSPLYIRATAMSEIVREEADSRGIGVADLWSLTKDRPDLVSGDGMHPNDAGHQVIADAYWERIQPIVKHPPHGAATFCDYSEDDIRKLLG